LTENAGKKLTHPEQEATIGIGEHQWGQTYTFDKMWIIDRVANLGKMIER
jgi:hypothetical protein